MCHQTDVFSIIVPGLDTIFNEELVPQYIVSDVASYCKVVAGVCSQTTIEGMMERIAIN